MFLSFKRDIIIKSQFSVNRGGVGTRGNTPGDFVLRYMARDGATETIVPVAKNDVDSFVTRYMARDDASERATNLPDLREKFDQTEGLGGRAFGKFSNADIGTPSLSDQAIRDLSKQLQHAFDTHHTVFESVISFDGNYLKRNNLADKNVPLDEDGHALVKGAFRGKVDQMKLRLAIMDGLGSMMRHHVNGKQRFDDLAYVGVIQVDTQQVHCHLAMADMGRGNMIHTKAGWEQKGVLSDRDMMNLRRGIDNAVNSYQPIRELSAEITRDKQDTRSYVKRYAQYSLEKSNMAQIILAVLPPEKSKWRAKSNSREMRQANQITRFYVQQVLSLPESGYEKAMSDVEKYALNRQQREQLPNVQYKALINEGQNRIINSSMDAVYGVLKTVPQKEKTVHTNMLDNLTTQMDNLTFTRPKDPSVEFAYHLRSYTHRLRHHREKAKKYHDLEQEYLKAESENKTNEESKVMLNFYRIEGEYQNKLCVKYQTLMPLISRYDNWKKRQRELVRRRDILRRMQRMMLDRRMQDMTPEQAEMYGSQKYHIRGGQWLPNQRNVYVRMFMNRRRDYEYALSDFRQDLLFNNQTVAYDENQNPTAGNKKPYKFKDVKFLDLQDVANDFDDLKVSDDNVQRFVQSSQDRYTAYKAVRDYALKTNQPQALDNDVARDIDNMVKVGRNLSKTHELNPQTGIVKRREHHYTISSDNTLSEQMQKEIKTAVAIADHEIRNTRAPKTVTNALE